MGKAAGISTLGIILLAGGMMFISACSSGSGTPVGPTGFTSGKAVYQDLATIDEAGTPVPIALAPVYVDGAPGLDNPEGNEVFTDEFGNFSVYLEPATAGPITYLVEVRDPTSTEDPAPALWSRLVAVGTVDDEEPDVVEDDSNGIGQCVSMCTKLYNPSSSVDRDLLLPIMKEKANGNQFHAKACQDFCKPEYRGSFPGDAECNPFYRSWDGSSCADPVVEELPPEEPLADEPPADEPPPDGGGEA